MTQAQHRSEEIALISEAAENVASYECQDAGISAPGASSISFHETGVAIVGILPARRE